jgi:hypothetical protein
MLPLPIRHNDPAKWFAFGDDLSLFSVYGPSFWHANGVLISGQMPGMPGFAWQGL